MGKHFTEKERYQLEAFRKIKMPVKQISKELGKSPSAIYAELRRGRVNQIDTQLRIYTTYKADAGQRVYDHNQKNKGRKSVLCENNDFLKSAEQKIVKEKLSPYCFVEDLKKKYCSIMLR